MNISDKPNEMTIYNNFYSYKCIEDLKRDVSSIGVNNISSLIKNNLLRQSARDNKSDFVKFFIEIGGYIEISDNNGYTPLSLMCQHGNLEMVRYLVSKGANISTDNDTPLIMSCDYGHLDIVKFFIIECNLNIDYVFASKDTTEKVLSWATTYKNSLNMTNHLNNTLSVNTKMEKQLKQKI